jgi:hypothetical protein
MNVSLVHVALNDTACYEPDQGFASV